MSRQYLLYHNGNGTSAHELEREQDPAEKFRALLEEYGDSYDETEAYWIQIVDGQVKYADRVYLPELEEVF